MPVRITPVVKFLAISCLVAFILQQTADRFLGLAVGTQLALVPYGFVVQHKFWQILTYLFLHGDVTHLVLNLLMLVFIGGEIESLWGRWRFLRYYLICGVSAGLLYLLLQAFFWADSGLYTPMVGASGAIYGLLVAYGLIFSERQLLFMMLFPMKAKHFVWILMGVELMSSLFSGRSGVASAAHLGGMVAGFTTLWTRAVWLQKAKKAGQSSRKVVKKRPNHLKLVAPSEEDSENDPKTWH